MTNVFKTHPYRLGTNFNWFLTVRLVQKKIRTGTSFAKSLANLAPNLLYKSNTYPKVVESISKSVIELESINNNIIFKSILLEPTILLVLTFFLIKINKCLTQF